MDAREIIDLSNRWINEFVIGLGLCPFAAGPYNSGRFDLKVVNSTSISEMIMAASLSIKEVLSISPEKLSNRMIVLPFGLESFEDYLEFYYACEDFLDEVDISEELQLTTFHPQYIFEGSIEEAPENYTNRSPYPMIHVLRKNEVKIAIDNYGDTSLIYQRNIKILKELGVDGIQKII